MPACILFLCLLNSSMAQTPYIDSVKQVIAQQKDASKKLESVFALCDKYSSLHPDTLQTYLALARQLSGKDATQIQSLQLHYYEAIWLSRQGLMDSAKALIEQNLAKTDQQPEYRALENRYQLTYSNFLIRENKQKEAIDNSLKVLELAEKSEDHLSSVRAKTSIGWAYMELNQNREALNWFLSAEKTDRAMGGSVLNPPVLYSNIAAVYNELKENDSAESYVQYAIDLASRQYELTSLVNAYYIYSDICMDKGNNAKAEQLLQEGLGIRKKIGDPFYIVSDITQMGTFYARTHQPQKGIAIIQEGIEMANRYHLDAKIPILYQALAENYKAAGETAKYSDMLARIIVLKDSLYEKNSAEALSEIHAKYDIQKKENTIMQQKYELTKKNNLLYGSLFLLLATVVIGYVMFQSRKKSQQLKMQELLLQQKNETTRAVIQAEENERKRIAEELHDSVAQKMVVAKLNLEALDNYLPALKEEQRQVFDNIVSLVNESATEVRNLSHTMMPQALVMTGLVDAVKNFTDRIDPHQLELSFNAEGNFEKIDQNKQLMIYRIIRECIQNVLKHAHATALDISMIAENDAVDILIEDNGVGFDTNTVAEGMGMQSIRSRIDFLNGRMEVNSRPGKGTVIAFYIPLKQG